MYLTIQRTLGISGSITLQLVSSFTSLDSTASLYTKTTYFLCWSSPVLLNWRPAVKWSFPQRWVFSGKSIDNKLPYDMSNSLDYTALTYGSVRASVTRWWNKKRPNFPQIAQKIGTHLLHNSDSITNNPKSHKNIWATVVRQFVAANS